MPEMLLKYCAGLLLILGMGLTTPASAETATATDTEEVIVAREIPMLPASIPRVETVADETFVGVQNLRFEDFEKDI